MTTIARSFDPVVSQPYSSATALQSELNQLVDSCNQYSVGIQQAFDQLALLTQLLLEIKEQLTARRAEYDQLRLALANLEEMKKNALRDGFPTRVAALEEQITRVQNEMVARAAEIEELSQRIADPGSDINKAFTDLQENIEKQLEQRTKIERQIHTLRREIEELQDEEQRRQAEQALQEQERNMQRTDQAFADLLFSGRQGGVVPYETVLEWVHAITPEGLEADGELLAGALDATLDSEGRSASTRVDALVRNNIHRINDELERFERVIGHDILRLDVTRSERACWYVQDVVSPAKPVDLLTPGAPDASGLPLGDEPLATPADLALVAADIAAGSGFAIGDAVARSVSNGWSLFADRHDAEGEGWLFTGNSQHQHLLKDHANLLKFIFATMARDFSAEGTDPRVDVMDCSLPPGVTEDSTHPDGAHAGGRTLDLGYYTTGPTNITQGGSLEERTLIWDDGLDTEVFDWERNFTLWSRIHDVFPESYILVHSEIRNHVLDEVKEKYGTRSREYAQMVDMVHSNDQMNHHIHTHVVLNREINWDQPLDWYTGPDDEDEETVDAA